MIGTSLPLGVLTDNPNQEADKRLLDAYGGSTALLRGLREAGVGAIVAPGQGLLPRYTAGMYRLGNTVMCVSRGLGNSSFPLRIGNKPELVTVILRGQKS